MKRSNIVFSSIAAVVTLGVLANCSDRMGQMRNSADLRMDSCVKYNRWAQKTNRKALECSTNVTGGPSAASAKKPAGPLSQEPLTPKVDDGRGAQPPRQGDGTTPPVEKRVPGDVKPGDEPKAPAAPGTPQPQPGDGATPPATHPEPKGNEQKDQRGQQEAGVPRSQIAERVTQELSAPGELAKKLVKGITISSQLSAGQAIFNVEGVIVVQNDKGEDEIKMLVVKNAAIVPFESEKIAAVSGVELKANEQGQAEELKDKVLALAMCNVVGCNSFDFVLQFKRKEGNTEGYAFAVCKVESGGAIQQCNFETKSFAEAQTLLKPTGLPASVIGGDLSVGKGDLSQAPGQGDGSISQSGGVAEEQRPAQEIAPDQKILEGLKEAKKALEEKVAAVNVAMTEVTAAKDANDVEKAKTAMANAEAAAKEIADANQVIQTMKTDLTNQTTVSDAQKKEVVEIAEDAQRKSDAAQASAKRST